MLHQDGTPALRNKRTGSYKKVVNPRRGKEKRKAQKESNYDDHKVADNPDMDPEFGCDIYENGPSFFDEVDLWELLHQIDDQYSNDEYDEYDDDFDAFIGGFYEEHNYPCIYSIEKRYWGSFKSKH